jgi:nitroreductase
MANFNEIIYRRRSIRKFESRAVEREKQEQLLKAALLAPSGKSTYPCEFILVDDAGVLETLSNAKTYGAALLAKAPMAIVVVADTTKYDVWVEDASIASTFIMLEAENLGLGCCWVQMRLRGTADGVTATHNMQIALNLASGHEVLAVLAIGYKAETKSPYTDADLKTAKLHYNTFGTPIK